MTAQGRGGATRDTVQPAHERRPAADADATRPATDSGSGRGGSTFARVTGGRQYGARKAPGAAKETPRRKLGAGGSERTAPGSRTEARSGGRSAGGKGTGTGAHGAGKARGGKKALPDLKRVQLDAPAPDTVFVDRDGARLSFPDSNLKRVAARLLTDKNKVWRYRAFPFPLFTDRGSEQSFHFDFYIYDAEDSVIRLVLVVPFESREVWDRVGRFKRQYPMYTYELWTPEKLAQLQGPRGRLGF